MDTFGTSIPNQSQLNSTVESAFPDDSNIEVTSIYSAVVGTIGERAKLHTDTDSSDRKYKSPLTDISVKHANELSAQNTTEQNPGKMTVDEIRVYGARQNAPAFTDGQLLFYMDIYGKKADLIQQKALKKQSELLELTTKNRSAFEDAKTDALKNALEVVFSPNIKSLASLIASLSDIILKGQITPEEQKLFDEMISLRKTEQSYRDMVGVYLEELESRKNSP